MKVKIEIGDTMLVRSVLFCEKRKLNYDTFVEEAINDCIDKYKSWEDQAAEHEKKEYKFSFDVDGKWVVATSKQATIPFILNPLDIEFIEQDIFEAGASNGELEVIVDEGLITIQWKVEEINTG